MPILWPPSPIPCGFSLAPTGGFYPSRLRASYAGDRSPVGGAITSNSWVARNSPRYFCTFGYQSRLPTGLTAIFQALVLPWSCVSGSTRSCFYPPPFAAEPVHDSVFKVLYGSSFLTRTQRSYTGQGPGRLTTAVLHGVARRQG